MVIDRHLPLEDFRDVVLAGGGPRLPGGPERRPVVQAVGVAWELDAGLHVPGGELVTGAGPALRVGGHQGPGRGRGKAEGQVAVAHGDVGGAGGRLIHGSAVGGEPAVGPLCAVQAGAGAAGACAGAGSGAGAAAGAGAGAGADEAGVEGEACVWTSLPASAALA